MSGKNKSNLIRISEELEDRITLWANKQQKKKSSLIREAIRFYLKHLESDDPQIRDIIRAIIISKLDKIQYEFDRGQITTFIKETTISSYLNCYLCFDDKSVEYIVYRITQYIDEPQEEAISRYAQLLYEEWRRLPIQMRKDFMGELHQTNVYFSMISRAN